MSKDNKIKKFFLRLGSAFILDSKKRKEWRNSKLNKKDSLACLTDKLEAIFQLINKNNAELVSQLKSDIINNLNILSKDKGNYIEFMERSIAVSNMHSKVFTKYKNIYAGKSIAVVATGPTLADYIPPEKDLINIGVNRAFLSKNVNLDYIFMQDYRAVKPFIEKIHSNKYSSIKKFYGILESQIMTDWVIPESIAIRHDAERYYQNTFRWNFLNKPNFPIDISSSELGCGRSIIFPAIQFALWTNPKKIYLVGCDCTTGHYEGKEIIKGGCFHLTEDWAILKEFANTYYPETEIISINPKGLKGLFKDMYTNKET